MNKRIRDAGAGALLLGGALAAQAEEAVAPPAGAALVLDVMADGVQVYACEMKDGAQSWVFKAPEAALFDAGGLQVGTHFAGPTWKAADGSAVVGEVVSRADAPEKGAIPWLLLRTKSHEGSGILAGIAFIRRAETRGGLAPAAGCDAAHAGATARMRYSARYQFFAAAK